MWKESYIVGVDFIDEQHKSLFKAIEALRDNLLHDTKHHNYKKYLFDTTTFLLDYCANHFSDEQEYQRKIGFAGYVEHKHKHDKLAADVTKYKNELLKSNFESEVVKRFLGFLSTWLIYHIGVEDQKIPGSNRSEKHATRHADVFTEYASHVRRVLSTLASIPENTVSFTFGSDRHIASGVVFTSELTGIAGYQGLGLGFVYSHELATGLVKTMMGMDVNEFDETAASAMQEISEIITARIAGLLTRETQINANIEPPKRSSTDKLDRHASGIIVSTDMGDMEVVICQEPKKS